jgi:hypothetical protein
MARSDSLKGSRTQPAGDLQSRVAAVLRTHQAVRTTVKHRQKGHEAWDAWQRACCEFHAAVSALYAPVCAAIERLDDGDVGALETAVAFLELDPYCFRSGYVKADLLRRLKHMTLTRPYAARLQQVILAAVDRYDRREFRGYCRLAKKVNSPELRAELAERLTDVDPGVRRRARWALEALETEG